MMETLSLVPFATKTLSPEVHMAEGPKPLIVFPFGKIETSVLSHSAQRQKTEKVKTTIKTLIFAFISFTSFLHGEQARTNFSP
jgi:hypothetical protein